MPVSTVNSPGTPPTRLLRKKFSQASASVQDGITYGSTNTADKNGLYLMFVRVTSQAMSPPKPIAMKQVASEIQTVFKSGL